MLTMAQSQPYSIYGLTLTTELNLNLPRATYKAVDNIVLHEGDPDDFAKARALLPTPSSTDWCQQIYLNDGSVFMRWEEWIEFIVSPTGDTIAFNTLTDGPLDAFEAYIANFAVSAAMVQRGEEPLHATVVDLGGRTIGLLGRSGAGKSTLAAYLLSEGAALITDDMLRIVVRNGQAWAQPGPRRLKLLPEPAALYLAHSQLRGRWNPLAEKFLFEPKASTYPWEERPLAALFELSNLADGHTNEQIECELLSGLNLFRTISSSTMSSRFTAPARLARQLKFAGSIGRLLPVYRLAYPRRYDIFPEIKATLDKCSQ